jgi:transcriptional regulator with XRE-family HTH domain
VRRVKAERKRQGVTAAKLAERCAALGMPGLNTNVIANLETDRRGYVTVDELFVLADALDVSPRRLLPLPDRVSVDDEVIVRRVGTAVEVDTALPVMVVRSGAAVGAITADATAAAPAPTVLAEFSAAEDE